jgi:hypothetical protein
MRRPFIVAALGLGLDVVIFAAVIESLPWLGLGCLAIACGVFDGLCVREPFVSDTPDELD